MKALTILLAPVIGLAALGARAVEGTSLTGTGSPTTEMAMALLPAQAATANISRGATRKRRRLRGCQPFIVSRLAHYARPQRSQPLHATGCDSAPPRGAEGGG